MNGLARQLALVAGALALSLGTPALASAAQSFQVTSPTGFPAGQDPSYTTTQNLDSGAMGQPGKVTITLAPGALASLAANPSCVKTLQYTSACDIGSGTAASSLGVGLALTAYLVPPPNPSTDAAGIDLLTGPPANQTTHVAIDLVQTATGNVSSVLKFDLSSLGPVLGGLLTKFSLTVNGTLGGKPFTRMPSNCNVTQHSSLTVEYANGSETTQASPDFAPTGCASLPFNPQVSASAVKGAHDNGVEVTTSQTQAVGEAAAASTSLQLPWPTLFSNSAALPLQNTSTPVGKAVAASPLQPAPLTGLAYLTGGPFTPTLTLRFPPPVALTLIGNVNLSGHSVTFASLPDVPQTSLVVTLFGGPQAAETTSCAPPGGILHATNTGQNGAVVTESLPITVVGCPTAPKLGGVSLSGLASGKPGLSFSVSRGSDAPNLKSVTVTLPRGLSFVSKRLGKGIAVAGSHTLRLSGGALTITFRPAVASLSVRIGSAALVESKQLQRQVKQHKDNPTSQLRFQVMDADGSASTLAPS